MGGKRSSRFQTGIAIQMQCQKGRSNFEIYVRDRPREGGEVDSSLCSNLARKEATPLGEIPGDVPTDMTEASRNVSKCLRLWSWSQLRGEHV